MAATILTDADLHGLVDGHVEPGRRADLLRRLAASPADRALVETWQDQADQVREAFRDVLKESLPATLDLAPPRLRSVDLEQPIRKSAPRTVRHGGGAAIAAALLITIGLTLSWMAGSRDDPAAPASAHTTTASDGDRAVALPSFRLPDLSGFGVRLTDVSPEPAEPSSLVLRYRDRGEGRFALKVVRNGPDIGALPIERAGQTLTWRSQDAAFTLSGNLPPERLRSVAVALQSAQGSE